MFFKNLLQAAKLLSSGSGIDDTYANFFPESILREHKIRELRKMVIREFQKMDADGLDPNDAATIFLTKVKKQIFPFDREQFDVKLGQGWSVKVPLVIGPDDEVSYLQQNTSTLLANFSKIEEIEVVYEPECRLRLTVRGTSDQLNLSVSDKLEVDNLADLIDGYCRGLQGREVKKFKNSKINN